MNETAESHAKERSRWHALTQPGRARYTLLMLVFSILGVVLAGGIMVEIRISAAEHKIETREREADRRWCALLAFQIRQIDNPQYRSLPEAAEARRLVEQIRKDVECE
jgi:hypothetical protein